MTFNPRILVLILLFPGCVQTTGQEMISYIRHDGPGNDETFRIPIDKTKHSIYHCCGRQALPGIMLFPGEGGGVNDGPGNDEILHIPIDKTKH